jgi:hypothetical protein
VKGGLLQLDEIGDKDTNTGRQKMNGNK